MAVEIDAIQSAKSIGWTDALLSRLAANSVGLGARLSITAPANASALSSTGYSLTGSNAQSMIDLAGTLNTTGSPAIIKVAISNTASGATTKFLSMLAGASGTTEIISFSLGGNILVANGGGVGSSVLGSPSIGFPSGAETQFRATANYLSDNAGYFGWRAAATRLYSDASNQLDFRNSTNAQAFNIYNTYTSGSVYERGFMRWAANVLEIGTEHVGASARDLVFKYNNVETVRVGSVRVDVTGAVAATAWVACSYLRLSALDYIHMYAPANGVVTLYNATETDFNRLQFGGTTSSFPSLKRSSTVLQSRLADDSDFAPLQGQLRSHANATSETVTPTHTLRLFDAAGTEYRVPAIAV